MYYYQTIYRSNKSEELINYPAGNLSAHFKGYVSQEVIKYG